MLQQVGVALPAPLRTGCRMVAGCVATYPPVCLPCPRRRCSSWCRRRLAAGRRRRGSPRRRRCPTRRCPTRRPSPAGAGVGGYGRCCLAVAFPAAPPCVLPALRRPVQHAHTVRSQARQQTCCSCFPLPTTSPFSCRPSTCPPQGLPGRPAGRQSGQRGGGGAGHRAGRPRRAPAGGAGPDSERLWVSDSSCWLCWEGGVRGVAGSSEGFGRALGSGLVGG